MEITLRPFRRHDFDALWKIDQECFPPGIAYSKHELSHYIQRRGSFTLVAEMAQGELDHDEGRHGSDGFSNIAGFIVAEMGARGVGHIITVDVRSIARRSGTGSKLLAAAEDWLRNAKCFRVRLETAVDNHAAHAFYERHGYVRVGKIAKYYENGLDAYSMEKKL